MDFSIPVHLLGSQREVEVGGVWSAGMAYGSRDVLGLGIIITRYFLLGWDVTNATQVSGQSIPR